MSRSHKQGHPVIEAAERFFAGWPVGAGDAVVVGVSGGADSVALLAVLVEMARQRGRNWHLTVGHLHHGLRPEADADARFVADLASGWKLPCATARQDVAAEARRSGRGIEETGRDLRYAFLQQTALEAGASCVAVGHHADDNVETILYRIFRGTHLRGLAGMPAARKLKGSNVQLIRPLLHCRREQIEDFCRSRGLQWRTDASNANVGYRRNFIRHKLLPLLRENLNPKVDEALLRLAASAGEADRHLAEQAEALLDDAQTPCPNKGRADDLKCLVLDAARLAEAEPVIRSYIMRAALEKLGLGLRKLSRQRLAELARMSEPDGPAAVALPQGHVARRRGGEIVIGPSEEPSQQQVGDIVLRVPGWTDLGDGLSVSCEIQPFDEAALAERRRDGVTGIELLDADAVRGQLICRSRQDGDRFRPLGCAGGQSVSDFLTNLKLPRHLRGKARCICDAEGIAYLAPLRLDERLKVTGRTKRVLRLTLRGFDALAAAGGDAH